MIEEATRCKSRYKMLDNISVTDIEGRIVQIYVDIVRGRIHVYDILHGTILHGSTLHGTTIHPSPSYENSIYMLISILPYPLLIDVIERYDHLLKPYISFIYEGSIGMRVIHHTPSHIVIYRTSRYDRYIVSDTLPSHIHREMGIDSVNITPIPTLPLLGWRDKMYEYDVDIVI